MDRVEKKDALVEYRCSFQVFLFIFQKVDSGMRILHKNIEQRKFQIILWIIVFVTNLISNLQYNPFAKALALAVLALVFYAAIIYGNAYWLIPGFYIRRRFMSYVLLLLLLLTMAVLFRSMAAVYIDNIFSPAPGESLTIRTLSYSALGAVWICFISVMYRLALNYFALSKKQDEIKAEKAQTELHLLKQQIHPHFLFNTLNNIYFVAQRDSPEAAELIERLSDIIRYFIEESSKDAVYLQSEIELLKSYIELESIRMRYGMPVNFLINGDLDAITIPPLLLLPLVENVFKHGVDKRSPDNFAEINLDINNDGLVFTTRNKYFLQVETNPETHTGLLNLTRRLKLYYDLNYELITNVKDDIFVASLHIPVHEN